MLNDFWRALGSLAVNLSASNKVLTTKIQQLSSRQIDVHHDDTPSADTDVSKLGAEDDKQKEKRLRELSIEGTIMTAGSVALKDVVGLQDAKQALQEAIVMPLVFPHLFLGGRKPWKRILLYGPPGTGKSRLAQAIAAEIQSTFYCVSSADLVSSWVGESEKLIKELFCHATSRPGRSVIFIDEIDSICRQRCSREDEHTRRVKTELLKQMEGADNTASSEKVFLMCATNCPWELDLAFLRRFQKRIYIPLPDRESRMQLMRLHSQNTPLQLSDGDWEELADRTEGYSGSDLATLTLGALFEPIRQLQTAQCWTHLTDGRMTPCLPEQQGAFPAKLADLPPDKVTPRDVQLTDFVKSIATHRNTVTSEELDKLADFTRHFGDSN